MAPNILTTISEYIKSAVAIEFSIVLALSIFILSIKPFNYIATKRKNKLFAIYKKKLLKATEKKMDWADLKIPSHHCRISLLVPIIISINEEKKGAHWEKLKSSIFEKILIPRAQKLTRSKRWPKRLDALRCFLLHADEKNEPYLLKLLEDPTPIIQYTAAFCAAKLGTAPCANAIVDAMNKCERLLRHPFREALLRGDPQGFKHLEERLETDKDSYARVSCLEVLGERMNPHIEKLARRDLDAKEKNLRLSAIRALGHTPTPQTIHLLIKLLNDEEWEVRAVTARALGYLHAKEALSKLAHLLRDEKWWVRMNAALALKRLGKEGEKILSEQDPKKDLYAYEIAQYVLPLKYYE